MRLHAVVGIFISVIAGSSFASDARSYSVVPVGANLTETKLAFSTVETPTASGNTKTENRTASIKHTNYFDLFGNLGALQISLPYVELERMGGAKLTESGWGDATLLFGFGLLNSPALSKEDFSKWKQQGLSSAGSFSLTLPSGEYENNSSFNIGSNRYAGKGELQVAWRDGRFMLEGAAGGTWYSKNSKFRGQNDLEQKRLWHFESHASYDVLPTTWVSLDLFHVSGGEVSVNDRAMGNRQRSSSYGITAVHKIEHNQFLKFIYQDTFDKTSVSSSLEGVAISYNYLW